MPSSLSTPAAPASLSRTERLRLWSAVRVGDAAAFFSRLARRGSGASIRGQVLTRDRVLESVWGWEFTGDSRTVDVHIRWLREKIETDPAAPSRIVTVRGAGCRFEG